MHASRSSRLAVLALAGLCFLPALVAADTSPVKTAAATLDAKSAPATDPAHDAAAARMEEMAKPGPQHAWLAGMAGKWKAVTKSWFGGPEPEVTEGVSENKMILGGRYLENRFTGTSMGKPFEGYGLNGFDNEKKVYTMLWTDNFSTSMMMGEGTVDAAGKELVMQTTMAGPDGKVMPIRLVTKVVDPKTHVFSMYGPMEGKEALFMEITYTKL